MSISSRLDRLHAEAKQNKWLRLFSIFCRVVLAVGFITPGITKIVGERFTTLSNNHPMGHYLEALFHTGYYYPFIGYAQVAAAILLLIPRTAILGAFLYLPVIVNIAILSHAVRFEGSLLTSPLMVLANLYVLSWNYEKWKYILPFNKLPAPVIEKKSLDNKFPWRFFTGVITCVAAVVALNIAGYQIVPRNTTADCRAQFKGTNRIKAGYMFCDCIHKDGEPLDSALAKYKKAPDD